MTNPRTVQVLSVVTVIVMLLAFGSTSFAQEGGGEDRVPTGAVRAAEWKPSHEGLVGQPWDFAVLAGFAFFSADDAFDEAGFAAELKLSHDLASDFYVAGSYLLAFVSTDVVDPGDGSSVDETHTLHVPTVGVGYRAELSSPAPPGTLPSL